MFDLFKKVLVAGVGAAVVTKEKVQSTLDELVEKGRLSTAEAQQLGERIMKEGEEEAEKAKVEANLFFNDLLHRANLVTKDQYDLLEARIRDLEGRWNKEFPNPPENSGSAN